MQTVAQHKAAVTVSNLTTGAGPADATRFNQLLSLGVQHGHRIQIAASGRDAEAVVHALASRLTQHDEGEIAAGRLLLADPV